MRIIDGVIYDLRQRNYQVAKVNMGSIYLFYRIEEKSVDIKIMFHAASGYELSQEEYSSLIDNIRDKFIKEGLESIRILSLIFTRAPERARKYCLDHESHWIIDLNERKLLIFENQCDGYKEMGDLLESLLSNDQFSTDMYVEAVSDRNQTQKQSRSSHRSRIWFTPINTSIVVVNILIHIVVYYSGLLGEPETLLKSGALSWKYVFEKKEYYRLVTSMFLHSDYSHLFNNMIILLFVGDKLERVIGKKKYLLIYLGSGVIAALSSIGYNMIKNRNVLSIGASGAIFGIVGAVGYMIALNRGRMKDISAQQIFMFVVFSLYGGIVSVNIDNAAHVGGLIGGIILGIMIYRKDNRRKAKRRS